MADSSPDRTSPDVAELRVQYKAASEALAQAQLEELAALSDEEALRQIFSLRLFVPQEPSPRTESGLVEQQALFRRLPSP